MKKLPLFVALAMVCFQVFAQTLDKKVATGDLSLAAGQGFTGAASYNVLYGLGKNHKFRIGYSLRLNSYFAGETDHGTAPASLTTDDAKIDTLRLGNAQLNSLNLGVRLEYGISSKFDVGFGIDAVGFTFGGEQSGTFLARQSDASGTGNHNQTVNASPTAFNLLLIGDNDRGSLNSEFYVRYWISEKIGIRGGVSYQFWEYTAERKLAYDNDRFRSKVVMPMLAVSYKF
jgi:hypothetical protein